MFENIKIVMQIIPLILEIVKAVESQMPEGGKGKEKLTFVRETITAALPQVADIWSIVEKIINATVTLYNTTGVFKK